MAQLQNELAEKEMIKKFRHDNSWLSELKSKPNWVNNDVIKIPKQGAAPTVLINNQVYPITSANREDDFIAVALNKYDTTNTTVSDDELYALPYEKVSDVQQQHREELEDQTTAHALHSIAVPAATAETPVLETSGEDDGTGRKRLTTKDLIRLAKALSDLNVPLAGRVLVLSTDHYYDLLMEDAAREKNWGNPAEGMLTANLAGFKLYTVTYSPKYSKVSTVWTKLAYGSATPGEQATVAFYSKNAIKAPGSVKRYAREAANDPENRANTVGFRMYFLAVGIKDEGFAAIVSGATA
jgi:hypothetical protein